MKFLRSLQKKLTLKKASILSDNLDISERQDQLKTAKLNKSLKENIKKTEELIGSSPDLVIRKFKIGGQLKSAIIYIDGLVKEEMVDDLLHTLMVETLKGNNMRKMQKTIENILDSFVNINDVRIVDSFADLFTGLSGGETALFVDGQPVGLMCETRGRPKRAIMEPTTEVTIRGPRDGFIEDLRTNTALIRYRIRIPDLWFEEFEVGALTRTKVEIAYIKGLVNEDLIKEVRLRIESIKTDSILESGYIEEFIEDEPLTIFPLIMRTERPDKVAAGLLEGRLAIFVQGTSFVLLVPSELPMMLQAPDDYYEKFPIGTFIRFLRILALLVSLLLPGVYVAIINFHQELLPTALLLRVTAAREGIPFPVIVELLILEFLFELLREAGVRLPAPIGQAVSIVGALILGDAAIRAGLVSPAVVIVVALTAIAGFSTPIFSLGIAARIMRFAFTLLGSVMGLFGLQFGLLLLIVHLCSLRSFGVPYLAPVSPFILQDMKDNIMRLWWWQQKSRPRFTGQNEPIRQDPRLKPVPDRSKQKKGDG